MVTVTSTAPVPAGLVATICVAVSLLIVAATPPNSTAVADARPVPVIVTVVPPAAGPEPGLIADTLGAARYVNWSLDEVADVPSAVVTVTSTVPVPAGLVATICVAVSLPIVAATPPNFTAVADARPVPVIVTVVPPAAGPEPGLIADTLGAARYVNWSSDEVAEVPAAVVTVTSTVPVPAGLVATICVAVSLVIVAATPPKFTAVADARPVPVIVTVVPPAAGPELGLMPVTLRAVVVPCTTLIVTVAAGLVSVPSLTMIEIVRLPAVAVDALSLYCTDCNTV